MKRTPLKRYSRLQSGRASLTRGSSLRQFSKKRKKKWPARKRAVEIAMDRSRGRCEIRSPVCTGEACDPHEKLSRGRGGDDTDPENIVIGCRACHDYCHFVNPKWAEEHGFLIHSWEKK